MQACGRTYGPDSRRGANDPQKRPGRRVIPGPTADQLPAAALPEEDELPDEDEPPDDEPPEDPEDEDSEDVDVEEFEVAEELDDSDDPEDSAVVACVLERLSLW